MATGCAAPITGGASIALVSVRTCRASRRAPRRSAACFDRKLSGRGAWRTDLRVPRARAGAAATEVGTACTVGLAEGYRHDRCAVQLAADHGELHRPAAL